MMINIVTFLCYNFKRMVGFLLQGAGGGLRKIVSSFLNGLLYTWELVMRLFSLY